MTSSFSKYYRIAASEGGDIHRRRWAFEMCLRKLDCLATEEGYRCDAEIRRALPQDLVSEAVRKALRLEDGARLSKPVIRSGLLYIVLLRFRLLDEIGRYRVERRKEKLRGIRQPRRPAFSEWQIREIVRSLSRQLRDPTRPQ